VILCDITQGQIQDFWKKGSLGWRCTLSMQSMQVWRHGPQEIDAKLLQFRDIYTHYTTLNVRHSTYVYGEVLVGSEIHIIIKYSHNQCRKFYGWSMGSLYLVQFWGVRGCNSRSCESFTIKGLH